MAPVANELISTSNLLATELMQLARKCVVYRASIAYILQHINSFANALNQLRDKELTQSEIQAIQRFQGMLAHCSINLNELVNDFLSSVLNWSPVHMHNYLDKFRATLRKICGELSLNPDQIVTFDPVQDAVNKTADMQGLQIALRSISESDITVPNTLDVHQAVTLALGSIDSYLAKCGVKQLLVKRPSLPHLSIEEIERRREKAMSAFKLIDIPSEDLDIGKILGCGGFGTVYKAKRLSTAEIVAVKEARRDRLTSSTWASLYFEMATMMQLKHPYIVRLVGVHVKEPYRVITRFCSGKSLFYRLHKSRNDFLTPEQLTVIAYQVAEGMQFLHKHGIVHRDLKTLNVLIDHDNVAKIADFGLAGVMVEGSDLTVGVGTPQYTAPEILERKRYGPKVDVYSYGVILWEMATGEVPFRNKTHQEIYDHVVTRKWRFPIAHSVPPDLDQLIRRCWNDNPIDRPDFAEIVELFKSGKVYFKDPITKFEEVHEFPPLDVPYLLSVFADPSHVKFVPVVDFFVGHADPRIVDEIREKKVFAGYRTDSPNTGSILLLASCVLSGDQLEQFMKSKAEIMIEKVLASDSLYDVRAAAAFCLKAPNFFVTDHIQGFINRSDSHLIGPLLIRLLARVPLEALASFKTNIITYFDPRSIATIKDQDALFGISYLLPLIGNDLDDSQTTEMISLVELPVDVPLHVIDYLIEKTENRTRLLLAVVRAAHRVDATQCMVNLLQKCNDSELETLGKEQTIFDELCKLLETGKSVKMALLVFFRLAVIPAVPPLIANHPVLQSLSKLEGYTAMKLEIFTALFFSERFCSDTAIARGSWKLILSESEEMSNSGPRFIKLMHAITSHDAGCAIVAESEAFLTLISQLFLSSDISQLEIFLDIFSNLADMLVEPTIPELSLIISCIIQDLPKKGVNTLQMLCTLTKLLKLDPNAIQEYDLHNCILRFLTPEQSPLVIVAALQLLDTCLVTKLAAFYEQVTDHIYLILKEPRLRYPDILVNSAKLVSSLREFDIQKFLSATNFTSFLENMIPKLSDPDDIKQMHNYMSALKRQNC